jgi:hypothetical protein
MVVSTGSAPKAWGLCWQRWESKRHGAGSATLVCWPLVTVIFFLLHLALIYCLFFSRGIISRFISWGFEERLVARQNSAELADIEKGSKKKCSTVFATHFFRFILPRCTFLIPWIFIMPPRSSSATFVKCVVKGDLAVITLCREPVNTMNLQMWEALSATLDHLESNPKMRGVVFRSGLARDVFTAGNDILELYAPKTSLERYRSASYWCYVVHPPEHCSPSSTGHGHGLQGLGCLPASLPPSRDVEYRAAPWKPASNQATPTPPLQEVLDRLQPFFGPTIRLPTGHSLGH